MKRKAKPPTIAIATWNGSPKRVPAMMRRKGLAVTPMITNHSLRIGRGFVVTHEASGHTIDGSVYDLPTAKRLLRALVALQVNWRLPKERIVNERVKRLVGRARKRFAVA